MSISALIFNQIIIIMILIAVGGVSCKIGLISDEANKSMSKLVNNVVNPAVVFLSFQKQYDTEHAKGLIFALGLAGVAFAISMAFAYGILRKGNSEVLAVERFSCIYPNCGFMGIPLVYGLFGTEGVFYLTAYLTIFNILVWSHGVTLMGGNLGGEALKRVLKTPAIIATFLGIIFFITGLRLPELLDMSVVYIGNMNTPMAMMVGGATLARTDVFNALKNKRIYIVAIIKLIVIPLAVILSASFLNINQVIVVTTIIATASPSAITGTMFALTYDGDAFYASEVFTATTIMSIITIPLIIWIAEVFTM
ncbi:AEC family transporter [Alkalibaculum sp. M08DMB]|uniref:AEC family transporter n=1 Tax=Alkalibaculum sporogenes TaxID=2655001 RepID=A0A6A7K875_9FIRM|nr:AEC family transporter [Alkalibaculum sporogenes]MPW25576.1 AEC family transporter [Alkalibaculum sporogenes]